MTKYNQTIGRNARLAEGRGLSIHNKDMWISIQTKTFMNWVNLHIKESNLVVESFETDLCDGVKVCVLVESLQQCKIGKVSDFVFYLVKLFT